MNKTDYKNTQEIDWYEAQMVKRGLWMKNMIVVTAILITIGTATITVTTKHGKTATCVVTVS